MCECWQILLICKLRRDNNVDISIKSARVNKCMNYEAQVFLLCAQWSLVRNYPNVDIIKNLKSTLSSLGTWAAATNCFMVVFRTLFNSFKWYRAVPCDWYLIRESLTMSFLSWWICNGSPIKQRIVFKILVIT